MRDLITYRPLKAVDREFIYKISARKPRDPKINIFEFFIAVLGPGTCLDGFVTQFSCRYTPSDTRFTILKLKSAKFHPPAPSQSSQRLSLSSSRPSPTSPRLPWSLPLAGLGPGRDLGRFWRGRGLSSTINEIAANWRFLELIRGFRGSGGSGVISRSSEPPYHTRRGSG